MKKLLTWALGLVALAVLTGAVSPDATPWLNRDTPGGAGDYETIADHLKISCRFKATGKAITEAVPVGYHCNIKEGGWCKNNEPAGLGCQDMEVMFSWVGGSDSARMNQGTSGGLVDATGAPAGPANPEPTALAMCGAATPKGATCCSWGKDMLCLSGAGGGKFYLIPNCHCVYVTVH